MENKEQQITLDNKAATMEQIEEAKKNLEGNQRIVETKPGEYHKLSRMNG